MSETPIKTVSINGRACVTIRQAASIAGVSYRVMADLVRNETIEALLPGGLERWIPVDALENVPTYTVGRPRKAIAK